MIKIIIFIFLLSLDLLTKFIVKNYIGLNHSIKINQFFDIVYIQNFGVSFGLFSGTFNYSFFVIIGLLVVFFIIYLMIKSNKNIEKLAYFFIIIGALGNIIDRAINSYVVDFIALHYDFFYWPAFNLADIYITIGIIMLVVGIFIKVDNLK